MKIIGQGRKIEKWPPAVLFSMGNGQPPVLIGYMLYYPNESKTMRRTIFKQELFSYNSLFGFQI